MPSSTRAAASSPRAGAAALLAAPRVVLAQAATERRFVFVIQRGAADGLDTSSPYGDPAMPRLRGALALDADGATQPRRHVRAASGARRDRQALYAASRRCFVHAVASPYRERSHFDGQNVLETGGAAPHDAQGRLAEPAGRPAAAPPTARRSRSRRPCRWRCAAPRRRHLVRAVGVADRRPTSCCQRVQQLYADDAQLHALVVDGDATRGAMAAPSARGQTPGATSAALAARLPRAAPTARASPCSRPSGWDTHSAQARALTSRLKALDAMLAALRDGLGAAWARPPSLVATEFGRTAAANGTGGTDHGTASAAMLLGGGVDGGRVVADWPGLAARRSTRAATCSRRPASMRSSPRPRGECFGIEPERVARALFPQVAAAAAAAAPAARLGPVDGADRQGAGR